MKENRLVVRARNGDARAERELYDAHVDRVYRLAYRMTGREDLAEEFTQDAFVRAFDRLDDFRGEAAFSTWLHSVATSVIYDGLRKIERLRERETALEDAGALGRPRDRAGLAAHRGESNLRRASTCHCEPQRPWIPGMPGSEVKSFLQELKRRKVIRVAAVYGAVAFVVVQAASYVFPALLLPDVAFRILVVLALFGFPIALVLAWAFEVTPEGVRRTPPVGGDEDAEETSVGAGTPHFGYGHLVAVFGAGILASLVIFGLTDPLSSGGSEPSTAGVADEDRVVIVPFRNRTATDSLDPVGTMAADWIAEGLSRTGVARTVPVGTARAAARSVREETGGAVPPRRIADRTGAALVVSGGVYRQGDSLHLQAEVTDARSGNVAHSLGPATARVDAPMSAVEEIRQRVLGALATEFDSLDVADALERDPPTYEAYRHYALGMEAFSRGDMRSAADFFRRAHRRDSSFVLPLAKAVAAYLNLDQDAAADSLVRRIRATSNPAGLRPFTRAMVEYRRAQVSGTRRDAYVLSKELAELAPGSAWEYVVGRHALCRGREEEAVRVLSPADTARGLSPTSRGKFLALLAEAHHLRGQFEQELEIVRRLDYTTAPPTRTDAPPSLVYDSSVELEVGRMYDRLRPLAGLGRIDRLQEMADRRLSLPGDVSPTTGELLTQIGRELAAHGSEEAAREFHDRSVTWHRERPTAERDSARYLMDLGWSLYAAGRFEEARPVYRRLVEMGEAEEEGIAARTSDRHRGRMGVISAALGDTGAARRVDRWLASDSLRSRDPGLVRGGWALYARAAIAAQLGEAEAAFSLLRRARARGCWDRIFDHLEADPAFEPLEGRPEFRELVT